ncbi:MAG: thioredoxin family protein [Bacteroidetes bacterium]|nr:thioredoxin family protein [Bacteroidota bacterium]MBU1115913.1 thioredoxin family protein [Bacteroidota bacterium]MBU1798728.1 thioredoxin family protein [Bacteroidota bacterium]
MKKISVLLLATFILIGCANNNQANDKSSKNGLVWHTNVEKAIEIGKKENKPVLVQFSGSDWCKWCIKLNNEVLDTKGFANFAKDNLVLVNLDFPHAPQTDFVKNYNRMQMNKYGVQGFPTVLLLDKTGKLVFQTGYQPGGPVAYIQHIKAAYGIK